MNIKGRKLDCSLKFAHYAKVTIPRFSSFPIDMLRYDRCCPNREVDSSTIQRTTEPHDEPLTVIILSYREQSKESWAVDRWKSFGTTIEPISYEDTYKIYNQIEEGVMKAKTVTSLEDLPVKFTKP